MDKSKSVTISNSPLPWKKLIGAYVLLLCEAISTTSFFTYISPYIVFLKVTDSAEKVGYYAGFIASSFSIAQFISSFFWGKMSDKFGRKPILIVGSVGSIISLICIGTSWSLPILIISRSINGLLNGNIGVVKTYIGECTDKTNQIEAFGLIGLTWGLGSIVGPTIGGLLADPKTNYPSLFGDSVFFSHFPYILPNLVIAILTLFGCIFTQLFMKETLNLKKSKSINLLKLRSSPSTVQFTISNISADSGNNDGENNNTKPLNLSIGRFEEETEINENNINSVINNGADENNTISSEYSIQQIDGVVGSDENEINKNLLTQKEKKELNQHTKGEEEEEPNFEEVSLQDHNFLKRSYSRIKLKLFSNKNKKKSTNYKKLGDDSLGSESEEESTNIFKDKLIMKTTFLYACVGFIFTMLDEAFPLWAFAKVESGGLAMASTQVGICGAIGGVSIIVIQLFFIKPTTRKIGILKTFMIGCAIAVFSFISFPLLNFITPYELAKDTWSHVAFWTILTVVLSIRNTASQFIFTPVMTFINNSARVAVRGAANGLGQSLVALTRAIAPTLSGTILSWSLTNGKSFPLNYFFDFLIMSFLSLIPLIVAAFFLPTSINAPIEENDDNLDQDDDIENQIPVFE